MYVWYILTTSLCIGDVILAALSDTTKNIFGLILYSLITLFNSAFIFSAVCTILAVKFSNQQVFVELLHMSVVKLNHLTRYFEIDSENIHLYDTVLHLINMIEILCIIENLQNYTNNLWRCN